MKKMIKNASRLPIVTPLESLVVWIKKNNIRNEVEGLCTDMHFAKYLILAKVSPCTTRISNENFRYNVFSRIAVRQTVQEIILVVNVE